MIAFDERHAVGERRPRNLVVEHAGGIAGGVLDRGEAGGRHFERDVRDGVERAHHAVGGARQFREQLEEEVQLEQARKTQAPAPPAPPPPVTPAPVPPLSAAATETPVAPDTFSHAHPTDATGADPSAVRTGPTPRADERGT